MSGEFTCLSNAGNWVEIVGRNTVPRHAMSKAIAAAKKASGLQAEEQVKGIFNGVAPKTLTEVEQGFIREIDRWTQLSCVSERRGKHYGKIASAIEQARDAMREAMGIGSELAR